MSEVSTGAGRQVGIDLARFFALAAMFFAYFAPSSGPGGVLGLAEFLAAPLFAMVLGISTFLSAQKMPLPILFASSTVRGLILVVLGEYVQGWGSGVEVVLQTLGFLSLLAVPLAVAPSWLLAVISALTWWFTLPVRDFFLPRVGLAAAENEYFGLAVEWLFTGEHFRAFTLVSYAALGIVLVRLMRVWGVAGDIAGLLVSATVVGVLLWQNRASGALVVYAGDRLEVGFNLLLAMAVLLLSSLLARIFAAKQGVLAPLVTVGRMTLSLYLVQLGLLAAYAHYAPLYGWSLGAASWWMLVLVFVLSFGFALLWDHLLGRTPVRRGPLETLLAWTTGRG